MRCLPLLLPFAWAACNLVDPGPGPWETRYSIGGFTALADSDIAVQLDIREIRWLPSNRTETRGEHRIFVIANPARGDVRRDSGNLPPSARPGLPAYFLACRDGRPVALAPGGAQGAQGDCRAETATALSSGGRIAVFGADSDAFQVLDSNLRPLFRVPGPNYGWNAPLAADEDSGFVTFFNPVPYEGTLRRGYWRRYPLDRSASGEMGYLIWPTVVRIAGYGARIVCSDIDAASGSPACWRPPEEPGFADAAHRFCSLNCEWNPATGRLLALMDLRGNFVSVDPRTGSEVSFPASHMLDSIARAGTAAP